MPSADLELPIYLDNHATTRVDPRVVAAMLPFWESNYGNAGSINHPFGDQARQAVTESRERIASAINATAEEIVFTSGATEANNLALRGIALHARNDRRQLVSVHTEHHAVLDPLERMTQLGFEVTLLPVKPQSEPDAGRLELSRLAQALSDNTALVTVMLANNEIGTLQPLKQIAELAHQHGALCHCDATQAVGKIPVDVRDLGVDLMSFSAHKIYGPKGVGALFVRQGRPRIRLQPQIEGGGQETGRRSGTLNVPGIVGFAEAVTLCVDQLAEETQRTRALRDQLYEGLRTEIPQLRLNGPELSEPGWRLPGNLNCCFPGVDGQAIQLQVPQIAMSSGAACTSTRPEPSHVLKALGLSDDDVRASLRFGIGRFNTAAQISYAIEQISQAVRRLQSLAR